MATRNFFCILLLLIGFFSCGNKQKSLSAKEFVEFFEKADNGYLKTVESKEISYLIQARTPEYIALKEQQNEQFREDVYYERIKQLDSSFWFTIKIISKNESVNPLKYNVGSLDEYNQRLNYFLNEASNYITLTYDGKPQKQVAYLFENNYGVTPYETMIVGFKLTDNLYNKEIILNYEDNVFKTGIINSAITKDDLQNKPILNF